MGILTNISGKEAMKAFLRAGWHFEGQTGSHIILTKAGVRETLSVPNHREVKPGTLRAIIRTAGLSVDEFLDLV